MPHDARRRALCAALCMTFAVGPTACRGTRPMQTDQQLIDALSSTDPRACNAAAAEIVERGERMIRPLLGLQGATSFYAGGLGRPTGSGRITAPPRPGTVLTPAQMEKAVTVAAAALYLLEGIHRGRLDFANSALLADLSLAPEDRRARNTPESIERGFEAARRWAAEVDREGLAALRARGDNPLKSASLAFW